MLCIITMKKIYNYLSYKKFIKDVIEMQGRGSVAKLAEVAGCNRTYLSQCLSGKVQLTSDHILGISEYLNLNNDEENFLLLLLLLERASTKKAQNTLKNKIEKIIQENLVLSKKITDKKDSNELGDFEKQKYYSSWKYAAVHSVVSIKDFQTAQTIAKKIRLPEQEVNLILKELNTMGLVEFMSGRWSHSGKNIHIPSGSIHTTQNHINWRLRSFDDVNSKTSIHYTTVFSLEKKEWETLRDQLLSFINKQRDTVHSSGSEELYVFCCDLFQPFD